MDMAKNVSQNQIIIRSKYLSKAPILTAENKQKVTKEIFLLLLCQWIGAKPNLGRQKLEKYPKCLTISKSGVTV